MSAEEIRGKIQAIQTQLRASVDSDGDGVPQPRALHPLFQLAMDSSRVQSAKKR